MTARLRDIVLSVRYGEAALVGESAGYLILGAADAALEVPRAASLDSVVVGDDGSVSLDASPCTFEQSEASLRQMLGQLLTLVRVPCPNLLRVAARRESLGGSGLVRELEAALVPVNRKASRRSLARLVRDAKKAAHKVQQLAAVAPVEPPVLDVDLAELADDVAPEVTEPAVFGGSLPATEAYREPSPVAPQVAQPALSPPAQPRIEAQQSESGSGAQPGPRAQSTNEGPQSEAASVAQACHGPSSAEPAHTTTVVATQVTRPSRHPHTSNGSAPASAEKLLSIYSAAGRSYVEPDVFVEHDELDEAPTQIYSSKVEAVDAPRTSAEPLPAPASPIQALAAPAIQAPVAQPVPRPLTPPAPAIHESPLPPSSSRKLAPIADEIALIPRGPSAREHRPSDIEELLDRMKLSSQPDDALYAGLKDLSRVDLSPVAPPVGMSWAD